MRLNFWQWLGVALLVIGGSLFIYKHTSQRAGDAPTQMNGPTTPPSTPALPASRPSTPPPASTPVTPITPATSNS